MSFVVMQNPFIKMNQSELCMDFVTMENIKNKSE